MSPTHRVIGDVAVAQRQRRLIAARHKIEGDEALNPARRLRDPRVLDRSRSLQANEATVMGPQSTFVADAMIEQAIDDRLQDYPLAAELWSTRAARIEPDIEHLFGLGFDGARQGKIDAVHRRLLRAGTSKKACRRSSRSLQNLS